MFWVWAGVNSAIVCCYHRNVNLNQNHVVSATTSGADVNTETGEREMGNTLQQQYYPYQITSVGRSCCEHEPRQELL